MKYLLDTANLEDIERYQEYFPIVGVTSNPTIIKKEGRIDFFSHMKKIRTLIGAEKSFHIQVTAKDVDGMMQDAKAILNKVDEKVFIKVPVTFEGIRVIKLLKRQGVNVTATAIYTTQQGFLAIEAGADYIAPYYNRMENSNINPREVICSFSAMIDKYEYPTKILAASFKNAGQVDQAFLSGAQTATIDPAILVDALKMPSILKAENDFFSDWTEIYGQKMIFQI